MNAVSRNATVTASVLMPDTFTVVDVITVTPLDPYVPAIQPRWGTEAPTQLIKCYTESTAPQPGYYLLVGTKKYPIRQVAPWKWRNGADWFCELVLEDIKVDI
jgi:hypothetical protein